MEDNFDIYEDLPGYGTKHAEGFSTTATDEITACEQEDLKKHIAELTARLEDFQKTNANLEINFSSLLKTAKAEIARKDEMIRKLREQLDNTWFRRGAYRRYGQRYNKEPQVEAMTVEQEWTDYQSHQSENKVPLSEEVYHDPWTKDESYELPESQARYEQPVTVFGQRLQKKIIDEINAEQKAKQLHKFNSNSDWKESGEGYVAESDKENVARCTAVSFDSKENKSCKIEQESSVDSGRYKTSDKTTDLFSSNEHQTDAAHRQRSAVNVQYVEKGTNENTAERVSVKRVKPEKDLDRLSPTFEKKDFNRYEDHNYFTKHSEFQQCHSRLRDSVKSSSSTSSATESLHTLNGITKEQQHQCFDVAGSRRNTERRNSREDSDSHKSKWHGKSTRKSRSPFDNVNAGRRYFDISKYSKKDDYRTKHREDHDVDRSCRRKIDQRSRAKSPTSVKHRGERCKRRKFDVKPEYYNLHEKFEKKYDSRTECSNQWKATVKKESHDLRKRLTRNRRAGSAEYTDYDHKYSRHEHTRIRSADRPNKHERRKSEVEESNREYSNEIEPFKDSRRNIETNGYRNSPDEVVERADYYRKNRNEYTKLRDINEPYKRERLKSEVCEDLNCEPSTEIEPTKNSRQITERNSDLNGHDDFTNKQHSSETSNQLDQLEGLEKLEDGEIPSSPEHCRHNGAKILQNNQNTISTPLILSSEKNLQVSIVEQKQSKVNLQTEKGKTRESSEMIVHLVPHCTPVKSDNAGTLPDPEHQIGSIESVENLENIEKFIRNFDSCSRNSEISPSSAMINEDFTAKLHKESTGKGESSIDIVKLLNDSKVDNTSENLECDRKSSASIAEILNASSNFENVSENSRTDRESSVFVVQVSNAVVNFDDIGENPTCEPKSNISDGGSQNDLIVASVPDREAVSNIAININITEAPPITCTSPDFDIKKVEDRTSDLHDRTFKCSSDSIPVSTKTDTKIIDESMEEKKRVSENGDALLPCAIVVDRKDNDSPIQDTHDHQSNHHRPVEDESSKVIVTEGNNKRDDAKSIRGDCNRDGEPLENKRKPVSLKRKSASENQANRCSERREFQKSTMEKSNVTAKADRSTVKVQGRVILLARRKNPVRLSNSDANMTILVTNSSKGSTISNATENNSALKPRACKVPRILKNT